MKKLLLILLLLPCLTASSQEWEKLMIANETNYPLLESATSSDGNVLALYGSEGEGLLLKMDNTGTRIWSNTYDIQARTFLELAGGNIILAGDKIMTLNSTGVVLSSLTLDSLVVEDIYPGPAGSYYLVLTERLPTDREIVFIAQTDPAFNIVWQTSVFENIMNGSYDLFANSTGVYFAGTYHNGNCPAPFLTKTDLNGNILFSNYYNTCYGSFQSDVTFLADGSAAFAGTTEKLITAPGSSTIVTTQSLFFTDPNGVPGKEYVYYEPNQTFAAAHNVVPIGANEFLLIGTTPSAPVTNGGFWYEPSIISVDGSGKINWALTNSSATYPNYQLWDILAVQGMYVALGFAGESVTPIFAGFDSNLTLGSTTCAYSPNTMNNDSFALTATAITPITNNTDYTATPVLTQHQPYLYGLNTSCCQNNAALVAPAVGCRNEPLMLAATGGTSFLWSTGETNDTITVTGGDEVWVEITGTCSRAFKDTTYIAFPRITQFGSGFPLGPEVSSCPGDTIIMVGLGAQTPVWSTGHSNDTISVAFMTDTYVTFREAGCPLIDTVLVNVIETPAPTITQDGTILVSSTADFYEWFFNGQPIANSNNDTLIISEEGQYHVVATYANSCSASSDTMDVVISTARENRINVTLQPNPASTVIVVKVDGITSTAEYSIVNLIGEMVASGKTNGASTIDISNFETGIYFITITGEGKRWDQKLIKQ